MTIEDEHDIDALAPDPPTKCATATCDQTVEDGELRACDGCYKKFCNLCLDFPDDYTFCLECALVAA